VGIITTVVLQATYGAILGIVIAVKAKGYLSAK
jgi:hypothetical protein